MAAIELFVGQTGALRAENQRDLAVRRLLDDLCRCFARIERRPGDRARTGTGADHQPTSGKRLFERPEQAGGIEHVIGAGGAGTRLGVWKPGW